MQKLAKVEKTGKNKQKTRLMKMDEGDDVNIEHIFIADMHHSESLAIKNIIEKCKKTENILDGGKNLVK